MPQEYMKYPSTVKALAAEIKSACNAYFSRKATNEEIKEIILWYASSQPDKLFWGNEINPTVSKIIGKKRLRLINDLLTEHQQRL